MARINGLLGLVVAQGANELQVASGREPKMFAFGVPKRLTIPAISEASFRDLLGEILSEEREREAQKGGRVELRYEAGSLGPFHVTLSVHDAGGGLVAVFVKGDRALSTAVVRAAAAEPSTPSVAAHPSPPTECGDVEPAEAAVAPATLASDWLARAASMGASDLHLADGEPPFVRVDGVLRKLRDEPVDRVSSLLGLSPADRDTLVRQRSFETSIVARGVGRIRLHAYVTAEGVAAALRLLPATPPPLAELRLPVPCADLVGLPHGLVLVCGATGAGKSTTLAALAEEALAKRSIVLVTLEDPIEYLLTPRAGSIVRRREVGRHVLDCASGLRDALREDPDVLLVGEMRDPETIALAMTAAETGHLVLASLHCRSAASAIERIVDTYPPERQRQIRTQLADSLRAVIAQRLVPRVHGGGRVLAAEVLRVTHAVANLIREGKSAQMATVLQSSRNEGMMPLERCLADLVQAGEIGLESARAAANDLGSLAMYLAERGH